MPEIPVSILNGLGLCSRRSLHARNANVIGPREFMAAEDGVVLVTFNSRLGGFGYLSTGEADFPGKWGLLDQVVSLDWILDSETYCSL